MNQSMRDIDSQNDGITADNIFFKIWTSPRPVFRFISVHRYNRYVTILLILSGIAKAFDNATKNSTGDHFSIMGIIGFCIVVGGICGLITSYVYAAMISFTGKWLDGKAGTDAILRVLAYAMVPSIVGMLFLI